MVEEKETGSTMENGWSFLVMKLFKAVWCSRRRRAGRFNVHQANHKNSGMDKVPGIIRHNGSDLFICTQVGISDGVSGWDGTASAIKTICSTRVSLVITIIVFKFTWLLVWDTVRVSQGRKCGDDEHPQEVE